VTSGRIKEFSFECVFCHLFIKNPQKQITHLLLLGRRELIGCLEDYLCIDFIFWMDFVTIGPRQLVV
jgi:hypothetical protein